jgi:hypothetical protein
MMTFTPMLIRYVGGATITMALGDTSPDFPDKVQAHYTISLPFVMWSDNMWESGRCHNDTLNAPYRPTDAETLLDAYAALLSFLGAAGESAGHPDSENADLFPADVTAWAAQYSDEIASAQYELTEDSGE